MAFSDLKPSDSGAYDSGKFTEEPQKTSDGTPDPRVGVDLGGWTDLNVIQIKITDAQDTESSLEINPGAPNSIVVTAADVKRPGTQEKYYSVKTGTDNRISEWDIIFDIYNDQDNPEIRYTGKWIFTKGKMEDDDIVAN